MTEIRIYFEGDEKLRFGFHNFLGGIISKAREARIGFELIAGGSNPRRDYELALRRHPHAWNILLRDTEGPAPIVRRDSEFWMVQLMEAWFLAHPQTLETYYGNGFNRGALKPNPRVEDISKDDVISCLDQATRNTQKGRYHKTRHAPALLAKLDPEIVRRAAPNCELLFRTILDRLAEHA